MVLHYIQHVPFEDLGYIEIWAKKKNLKTSVTKTYEKVEFPNLNEFDFLVIMGGPMSVYEEEKYPWLVEEKRFIGRVIEVGKPVLGICLGAQLIANVLGAKVYPGKYKEIGWFPVRLRNEAESIRVFSGFPREFMAFHWHGDTFDIPKGALWAAESDACLHQAFVYNDRVVALQFHLEPVEKSIENLIKNCSHELIKAPYIQSAEEMLNKDKYIKASNELMETLLENILRNFFPISS